MDTLRLKEFTFTGSSFVVSCNKRDLMKIIEYFKTKYRHANIESERLGLKKYAIYISFGPLFNCCTKHLSSFSKEIKKATSRDGVVLAYVGLYCSFRDIVHSDEVIDFGVYLVPSHSPLNQLHFCKKCNNTNVYTDCDCYNIAI